MAKPIQSLVPMLSALLLTACSGGEQAEQAPSEEAKIADPRFVQVCGPVSDTAFCGVRIGMTLAEARAAFPEPLESFGGDAAGQSLECAIVYPEGRPEQFTYMLINDRVARVDILIDGYLTDKGARVGWYEDDVLRVYGDRAKVFPNKYDNTKRDIVVDTRFNYQIIFETDGKKVLKYRAGVLPGVGFVEGCG
ncbi:MAG: hypothetical protein ACKVOI_10965 [Dongiaceae bacterium]